MQVRRLSAAGLAAAMTLSVAASGLHAAVIYTPDKYGAPLHGQVNIAGATLFENFFKVPASTNDYVDPEPDGQAGKYATWPPDQLAVDWPLVQAGQSTFWLVNYRGHGSVNGLGELLDYHGCGIIPTSTSVSVSVINRFAYTGLPSPEPMLDVSLAVMDVPVAWATVSGDPADAAWNRRPNEGGYGWNANPTSTGFPFSVNKLYLEKLSRDCDGDGTDEILFNANNDPPNTPNPDEWTLFDTQIAWVAVAVIANRGTGIENVEATDLHHLWVTGRMPNGENLIAATRTPFSGTRNAAMNCLGIDPSWGRGDNIGNEVAGASNFQLGSGTQPCNAHGSTEMETVVQNWRLAVGYTGLAGSSRAAKDTKDAKYEIVNVMFNDRLDRNGQPGSRYIRPTIGSVLDNILDNNDPAVGWQIGGPETFVSRGNPAQGNSAAADYMANQAARHYLNNITVSLANFESVPGNPDNDGMPGEWLGLKFFPMNAVDGLPSAADPTVLVEQASPPFNQDLQDYVRANNDLDAGGDVIAFGSSSKAGRSPVRNLNPNFGDGVNKYTDGCGTSGADYYCYCTGTLAGNVKMGSRNRISGDFNADDDRDIDDVEGMVAAYFNPRGWMVTPSGGLPPYGACIPGPSSEKEGQSGGNYAIAEVIGDFNGDGNFSKEDLRYFMDGLGLTLDIDGDGTADVAAPQVSRKAAAIAIDNAILAYAPATDKNGRPMMPEEWLPWADTRIRIITPPATPCGNPVHEVPAYVNDPAAPFLKTGKPYAAGDFRGDVAGGTPLKGALPAGWNGVVDEADIDYVCANFGDWSDIDQAVVIDLSCDMTGDLVVNYADVVELVTVILKTKMGDGNLDGEVDAADEPVPGTTPPTWANGDYDCDGDVDTDDHQIWQSNTTAEVTITEWRSVRDHAGASYALVLDPAGATSEGRSGGIQQIEVDLSAPVAMILGTIQATDLNTATVTSAASQALVNGGQTLVITFAPGLQTGCFGIDLAGNIAGLTGDTDVKVRSVPGDATGDAGVDVSDLTAVKNQKFQPITAMNFRTDVTVDGGIDVSDLTLIKVNKFLTVTCP